MVPFILSLIALVFAAPTLEERNEQLTMTNRVLMKALKDLTVGTETAVGNSDLADCMALNSNLACTSGISQSIQDDINLIMPGGNWYPNRRMAAALTDCSSEWACMVDFARDSSNSLEQCFTRIFDTVYDAQSRPGIMPALYDAIKINGLRDCDKDSILAVVKKAEPVWKEESSKYGYNQGE